MKMFGPAKTTDRPLTVACRRTWTGNDYGEAIANCARAHTAPKKWKKHSDGFSFPAWWRNGDSPKVRVWLSAGAWHDIKTGEKGGAKAFAEKVGLDLVTFMSTYLPSSSTLSACDTPSAAKLHWEPGEVSIGWERLLQTALGPCGHCESCINDETCNRRKNDTGRKWLVEVRGLPGTALLDAAGVGVDRQIATVIPGQFGAVLSSKVQTLGSGLVVPIRSAATNTVETIALRPFDTRRSSLKTWFLPGVSLHDADGAPRGYGSPAAVLRSEFVIVTEGLVDTVVADELTRSPAYCVAGATSAVEMAKRWPWLSPKKSGRVVVIPHLDGSRQAHGTGQDAAVELVARLRRAGVNAYIFRWGAFLNRLGANDIWDLGDVAQWARRQRMDWTRLATVFRQQIEGNHGG